MLFKKGKKKKDSNKALLASSRETHKQFYLLCWDFLLACSFSICCFHYITAVFDDIAGRKIDKLKEINIWLLAILGKRVGF